jgi:hypothetical protein
MLLGVRATTVVVDLCTFSETMLGTARITTDARTLLERYCTSSELAVFFPVGATAFVGTESQL